MWIYTNSSWNNQFIMYQLNTFLKGYQLYMNASII